MGPGIKRSYAEGFRLLKEVIRHNNNSGGVTVGIFGSKGSGKTTFLLTLANKIGCYNPYVQDSDDVEFETIIWRGRRRSLTGCFGCSTRMARIAGF